MIFIYLLQLLLFFFITNSNGNKHVLTTDCRNHNQPIQLAMLACSGFFNREDQDTSSGYVLIEDIDVSWQPYPYEMVAYNEFLTKCFQLTTVHGYIKYNFIKQQELVPNIITLAALLNAIPLDLNEFVMNTSIPLIFDADKEWDNYNGYNSTLYMYEHYINETNGMSKMNPGYDTNKKPWNPSITGSVHLKLTDYIIKEKLFNYYLYNGCIHGTIHHELSQLIINNNPWQQPVKVMGYDDTWGIIGDLFEAETTCYKNHNAGQIASETSNLAYYSTRDQVKLKQNKHDEIQFNKTKTYITLVVGDGDNIGMVKNARRQWMIDRVNTCTNTNNSCYPLVWTLSPHLTYLAPEILTWFQNQANITHHDYFILPPSGHLYSYPSIMPDHLQDLYVNYTEIDCINMDTNGINHWEWFNDWKKALTFFEKYQGPKGFFTVNVPFNFPVRFGKYGYTIVKDNIVVFEPREWRGIGSSNIPFSKSNYKTIEEMANEVNNYPKGTIRYIYLTSDGGGNITLFDNLVRKLDEHVEIVDHVNLINFAIQSAENGNAATAIDIQNDIDGIINDKKRKINI